jgi:hypothetical protein
MGTNVGETAEGVATFMTHLLGVFLLGPDGLGAGSEISGGRGEHQDIPGLLIHSPQVSPCRNLEEDEISGR